MNTVSEQTEAGRDVAAHIAEAIERDLASHIAEAIEQERFEIAPADLYRRALEEVIRDALKVFRPQAQEAGRDELLPCAWCGSPAASIGMAGMFTCSNEECMVGEASFSRNQWNRRDYSPANAEAVRLLRELRDAARAYWDGGMVGAAEKRDRFRLALRAADAYIADAQHGGRGDE